LLLASQPLGERMVIMQIEKTAVVLIGYQNDYFADDGILRAVIDEPKRINNVLLNTLALMEAVKYSSIVLVTTPIVFTNDYSELVEPAGILKAVKEAGAFKSGTKGSETIKELIAYGERILEVPGKRGLNAFSNTNLHEILQEKGVTDVCLAGTVTSVCIDSTGRSASEKGYRVHILRDCTAGRSNIEEGFYCDSIFPLYADVLDSSELLRRFGLTTA
jgi:nicotinamidase-related amidase